MERSGNGKLTCAEWAWIGVLTGFITGLLAFSFFATTCVASFAATGAALGAHSQTTLFSRRRNADPLTTSMLLHLQTSLQHFSCKH
jgi:dolichol kinase